MAIGTIKSVPEVDHVISIGLLRSKLLTSLELHERIPARLVKKNAVVINGVCIIMDATNANPPFVILVQVKLK